MADVVRPRNGAHGAPYREGVHRKIHHWREALEGKLSTAGKETSSHGIQVNQEGEQGVQNIHGSVRVNL